MSFNFVYTEWIKKASRDIRTAHFLMTENDPDCASACFLSQQCAEKALKAFILYNNQKIKYIHDLIELCNDCQTLDSTFKDIASDCGFLTAYYTATRYPNGIQCTKQETNEIIASAEKILNFEKNKTNKDPKGGAQ